MNYYIACIFLLVYTAYMSYILLYMSDNLLYLHAST